MVVLSYIDCFCVCLCFYVFDFVNVFGYELEYVCVFIVSGIEK